MSLDFYDSNGKAYAYSDDGLHIFSFRRPSWIYK